MSQRFSQRALSRADRTAHGNLFILVSPVASKSVTEASQCVTRSHGMDLSVISNRLPLISDRSVLLRAFFLFTIICIHGSGFANDVNKSLVIQTDIPLPNTACVQSEIFEISTRHLPDQFCAIKEDCPPFQVNQWNGSRWQRADIYQALPHDGKLTILYVHGNFMERNNALERIRIVDSYLKRQAREDYRLLGYSWPSERGKKPLRDVYENSESAEDQSLYLAWILRELRDHPRVSLLGFSFGARGVTGALHLDAGGSIPGLKSLSCPPAREFPYHLGLVAPAIDKNWIEPNGRHGLAISNIEAFVNMYNSRDPVLRRFRFIDRLSRPIAGGFTGFEGLSDPRVTTPFSGQAKVQQFDCGSIIGTTHSEKSYYGECPYFRILLDTVLWNPNSQGWNCANRSR